MQKFQLMNLSCMSPGTQNSDPLFFSYQGENNFEIKSLGHIISTGNDHLPVQCYKLAWIKQGKGTIRISGQEYSICDNTIYCMPPCKTCQVIPEDDKTDGYIISFTPSFVQHHSAKEQSTELLDLFTNSCALQVFVVTDNMRDELELTAHILLTEYTGRYNRRSDVLYRLLSVFIIYFTRHSEGKNDHSGISSDGFLFRKFVSLVKKNFISKKLVSDYADELCITANYLNRTVKKVSGFSASYHIQQQVITEAKKQAIYCGCNMKEIAYNLGFDNLAHFSKYFKKNTGTSFSCFRKGYSLAEV